LIERLYSVFTLTAKKLIGILPSEARLRLEILQKEYIKQFFFEKRVGSGGTCLKSFPCFGWLIKNRSRSIAAERQSLHLSVHRAQIVFRDRQRQKTRLKLLTDNHVPFRINARFRFILRKLSRPNCAKMMIEKFISGFPYCLREIFYKVQMCSWHCSCPNFSSLKPNSITIYSSFRWLLRNYFLPSFLIV